VRRGEVWWHEPPHEKPRPVLILTRDEHIDRQLDVIAAPATATMRGWDTEVELGRQD
jgi:mRNA-degrading endonuclease toxin of MazEF toxin-antitoxin module